MKPWHLALWLLILQELSLAPVASAQSIHKQVLVLYSTRRDARLAEVGDRELPRNIESYLGGTLDYYSEFLDQARFAEPDYHVGVREFLRLKYRSQKIDLLVAIGESALTMIAGARDDLFPGTPIVFFANLATPEGVPNSTGIVSPLNLADTLTLAGALQPEARRLFVISGTTGTNGSYENAARRQFEAFASRFEITYLSGLPTEELEKQLASLPDASIVFYLVLDRDGMARNFQPLEYLNRVIAIANAPVYSWVDSTMGMGIVGGSLKSQSAEMEAVSQLAVRVLFGEHADSIPISSPNLNVRQVDWRQLRRWGISEARVPRDTLIRFREPTAWDRYRGYIIAAVVALAAQSALIGGLLVQGLRRRQAEGRLRTSQAKLQASYEQISDLGGRLLSAQEAERSYVARELHDGLGQQVAVLVADLHRLSNLGQEAPWELEREAHGALEQARGLAKSLHDLSHRLHPATLKLLGLPAALDGLQRELTRPGVAIAITYDNLPAALPHDLTLCVFRVIQEALQNALKHSHAREILVHVHGSDTGLSVAIVDDGVGFDVNTMFGKGLGLVSMNERVEALGGTLKIRSTPRHGTRLRITVPVAKLASPAVAV